MRAPDSACALGPWLDRGPGARIVLSPPARQALAGVLDPLGVDPGRVRIRFGFTGRATAFVVGRLITIHAGHWSRMMPRRQLGLLAHELTHVAQYAALGRLGVPRFLARYLPDYHLDPMNYALPAPLASTPLSRLDPLDRRFTLDQIAERFRHEVDPVGRG